MLIFMITSGHWHLPLGRGPSALLCWGPIMLLRWPWADAVPSLVSSGFLHSFSTIYVNFRLQLAPSIKSHQLWC